jgi:hypothetical protein
MLTTVRSGIKILRFTGSRRSIYWTEQRWSQGKELTDLIDKEHATFVSRNEYDLINLADIAFENNAPDLSLKMMLKAINGENSAVHIHEKLAEWHQRFAGLIQNGFNNPDVFYYQLIIERNYNDLLNLSLIFITIMLWK